MNLHSAINKDYWLEKNPDIEFHGVTKAFYGTHLVKAKVYICGASMRYYQHSIPTRDRLNDPTFDTFMSFLKSHVIRFNFQKLSKVTDNRYLHVVKVYTQIDEFGTKLQNKIRIYDAHVLYAFYKILKKKPEGIKFARKANTLYIYGNNIDDIEEVINQLKISPRHILSITAPDEQDVDILLSGKEISNKANRFQYKVFLKPAFKNSDPTSSLSKYLESIKNTDEVEVPKHCQIAMDWEGNGWSWANTQRSYLYVKNKNTILLIKLLAGTRFSTCIELILPKKDLDK